MLIFRLPVFFRKPDSGNALPKSKVLDMVHTLGPGFSPKPCSYENHFTYTPGHHHNGCFIIDGASFIVGT